MADLNIAASYDLYHHSGAYDRRYPAPNPNIWRFLTDALPRDGRRILDFGSGTGRYTAPLLERTDATVVAYDISKAALQMLGERSLPALRSGRMQLVSGSLETLLASPATTEKFDMALMLFGVLAHIRPRARRCETLRAMHGLLKPGGRLLVTVPNARRRFPDEQRAAKLLVDSGMLERGDILYQRDLGGEAIQLFYHLYSLEEFFAELVEAEFIIDECRPESVLPERTAVATPGRWLDFALARLIPLSFAYGFAAVATAGAERAT